MSRCVERDVLCLGDRKRPVTEVLRADEVVDSQSRGRSAASRTAWVGIAAPARHQPARRRGEAASSSRGHAGGQAGLQRGQSS